jgi:integrase
LAHSEISIVTEKTERVQIIPIAPPLLRHLAEELPTPEDPSAPLFPRAYDNVQRLGRVGSLSRQFHKLLASAGLVPPEQSQPKNSGEAIGLKRRTVHPLSFHSLRHTTTSVLKNLGVNAATVMDIVGHQSTAVSTNYTHIDSETKRRAIALMPDVTGRPEDENQ